MGMDHYTIIRQLGGTSGAYLAVDKQNETKRVVIKRLADGTQGMQEVNVSMRARHPNIIPYLESFVHDGGLYVVLQYAEGGDLESHLERLARRKKALPHLALLRGFQQLISALKCCHGLSIMHRDVKPGNVFVNADASELYLGDFGSSKAMSGSASLTTTFVGSPIWLSPELLLGMPYSYPSDVWSLGCVFYEMACLRRPFSSDSFASLVRQITAGDIAPLPAAVPEDIRAIIMGMLQTDPNKRYGLEKVMEMTERAIQVRQTTAAVTPDEKASSPRRRKVVLKKQQKQQQQQRALGPKRALHASVMVHKKPQHLHPQRQPELEAQQEGTPQKLPQKQRKQQPRQAKRGPIGHAAGSSDSSGESQLSQWIHARNNDVKFIESYLQKFRPADDILIAEGPVESQGESQDGLQPCAVASKVDTSVRKGATPQKGLRAGRKVAVAPREEKQQNRQNTRSDVEAVSPADLSVVSVGIAKGKRPKQAACAARPSRKHSPFAREPSLVNHLAAQGFIRIKSTGSACRQLSPLRHSPQREEERQAQRAKREQERAKMLEMIREQKAKAMRQKKARGKSEGGADVSVEIVLPDHVRYFAPAVQ
ncbi:serine/threonine-protein kinase, putative [Trypanosoma brucei gambiense DAL972]|uniref:non-specific serine/threonine protein kinase n=1 Tax=Trypanosoma brucei gambiense (strain MHOM/CI/86/DAL972) TaxID=679716 RepID=C9ZUU0_TRYB9|nr:serine/threonine-protein kinase, putative [Trypanosoma brucei gambiense DAL972]CBH13178.1 serine/threonine-protein kinase, putative [Trypanosoma brucei gambiense DAL972]|eukprot:XP_011775455.1 serine/threonine-protein kinase, putative [Trypanosoma brucei gambiense DAL972]